MGQVFSAMSPVTLTGYAGRAAPDCSANSPVSSAAPVEGIERPPTQKVIQSEARIVQNDIYH